MHRQGHNGHIKSTPTELTMKAGSSKVPFETTSVVAKKVWQTKKPEQAAVAKKVERKKRVPERR